MSEKPESPAKDPIEQMAELLEEADLNILEEAIQVLEGLKQRRILAEARMLINEATLTTLWDIFDALKPKLKIATRPKEDPARAAVATALTTDQPTIGTTMEKPSFIEHHYGTDYKFYDADRAAAFRQLSDTIGDQMKVVKCDENNVPETIKFTLETKLSAEDRADLMPDLAAFFPMLEEDTIKYIAGFCSTVTIRMDGHITGVELPLMPEKFRFAKNILPSEIVTLFEQAQAFHKFSHLRGHRIGTLTIQDGKITRLTLKGLRQGETKGEQKFELKPVYEDPREIELLLAGDIEGLLALADTPPA